MNIQPKCVQSISINNIFKCAILVFNFFLLHNTYDQKNMIFRLHPQTFVIFSFHLIDSNGRETEREIEINSQKSAFKFHQRLRFK